MASQQIELEPYEQLNRAEDQHTYEDVTRSDEYKRTDKRDNSIDHEVHITLPQWSKLLMFTLTVSLVSTCTVLIVFYFTLFATLEGIMKKNTEFLKTKQNISASQILDLNMERDNIGVVLEHVKKNYTLLMTKQKTLEDFITALGIRPRDCGEIYLKSGNGIYTIFPGPNISSGFKVYCDFETDNGNWTVLQRRKDGTTDFFRGWKEYENGFGDLEAEFWLGNQKINELTSNGLYELRVDLTDFDGKSGYAKYSRFSIGNESTHYKLKVGGYSGNLGDKLQYNNGMSFSTKDRDNDHDSGACANQRNGAWWYKYCTYVNLNGRYVQGGHIDIKGITWMASKWKSYYSMKSSVMMLRKVH